MLLCPPSRSSDPHHPHPHQSESKPDYIRSSLNHNLSLTLCPPPPPPPPHYHGNPSPDSWRGQQMVTTGLRVMTSSDSDQGNKTWWSNLKKSLCGELYCIELICILMHIKMHINMFVGEMHLGSPSWLLSFTIYIHRLLVALTFFLSKKQIFSNTVSFVLMIQQFHVESLTVY